MAKLLTKDQIKKADDIEEAIVEVPEWNGAVKVRGLTGAQRDKYEASIVEQRGSGMTVTLLNARARLVIMAALDDTGTPMFSQDDISWLTDKSARALNRVSVKIQALSGMTKADEDELLGNSVSNQSGDGPSGSPSLSVAQSPSS